ncbi:MAG: nucleoside 2-deoxyribosyltransferase [Rhodospirillales bacterium]|nr:nucleoside 2-deoxyribosyltransferase [Rhodospirillales bacterium]
MTPRIYLAGPDVFLPAPEAWAARKKALCAAHGLEGVAPLDPAPGLASGAAAPPGLAAWQAIAAANEAHIRSCDALIANLTPFRGPSADPGTVFELGFMRALGRPVFGYAVEEKRFAERSRIFLGAQAKRDGAGIWRDAAGMAIEDFGLWDNLMIEAAILASGGVLITASAADRGDDLAVFARCVQAAATRLGG